MIDFEIALDIGRVDADSVEHPVATVSASGPEIHVRVVRTQRIALPRRALIAGFRAMASTLGAQGASICVDGPRGMIVQFGDVRGSWLSRRLTGSRNIRLGSPRAVLPVFGRRSVGIPLSELLPPSSLLPLLPTVGRVTHRRPTTTHARSGAGRPRLIFGRVDTPWDGTMLSEFTLLPGLTYIGSGSGVDLHLDGLPPLAAVVRHTERDEYVLVMTDADGGILRGAGPAAQGDSRILRTGARVELGAWRMGFFREEFADHGRPFGGRQGGELAHQAPQPSRPQDRN